MPFLPHTETDVREMLATIGVPDVETLFDEIPEALRVKGLDGIPPGLSEMEIGRLMTARARRDGQPLAFLGGGAYEHHIPAAVWALTTRGEFYSAYTPYQAEIAQGRLGPGRIHHCMRAIGMAERALSLMIQRANSRVAFGKELSHQGTIQNWIAESRIEIEQARLLVLKCAWMIDTHGAKAARKEIALIKVAIPRMAQQVVDRAIQVHGGAGVSQDTVLASMYAGIRTLRIVDGPDEVHIRDIARMEIKPYLA